MGFLKQLVKKWNADEASRRAAATVIENADSPRGGIIGVIVGGALVVVSASKSQSSLCPSGS